MNWKSMRGDSLCYSPNSRSNDGKIAKTQHTHIANMLCCYELCCHLIDAQWVDLLSGQEVYITCWKLLE